jgi:hypothetical protein
MSRDFIELGSAPYEENCAQVGSSNYSSKVHEEGERYIKLLRKRFGKEPEHARLALKSFPLIFVAILVICVVVGLAMRFDIISLINVALLIAIGMALLGAIITVIA